MSKGKFKAGVHPYEGKEFAASKEIKRLKGEEIMVFPMSQHIGAPATPCVKVTDRVLKGMKIGEASGFVSSPVYSSVSGTVLRIEDRKMLNGKTSKCVVIKNDFEDECVEGFCISREVNALSNEEIIKKLTVLKGIGQWTAEMYLIFSLGRENVLSKGDGTIRRTIQWMYDLEKLPSSEILLKYFSSWTQYATIVSSYLWKSIELGLVQKPFNEIISN